MILSFFFFFFCFLFTYIPGNGRNWFHLLGVEELGKRFGRSFITYLVV